MTTASDTPEILAPGVTPETQPSRAKPVGGGSPIVTAVVSSLLLAAWIDWQFGWVWALAGVFGVLVHELGHLAVINATGCGPGRIHFVPFLGGAATLTRNPDSEFKGVLIALAGPVVGLIAAAPFFALYGAQQQTAWLGGAFFIASINLLNLAPAPPLDGAKALGPVIARIHPLLERVALALVGGLGVLWAVNRHSFIFALFIGLGTVSSLRAPRLRADAKPLSPIQWAASLVLYLAAVAACLATLSATLPDNGLADPLAAFRQWGF